MRPKPRPVLACAAALALFLGACDDGAQSGGQPAARDEERLDGASEAVDKDVPHACSLISSAELSDILGADQGRGNEQGTVAERSICLFPTGTILAVEVVENFGTTRRGIESTGRETRDVDGVGVEAFFDPAGQLVARGEEIFVAVTSLGTELEPMKRVLTSMLEAAGETA